MKKSLILFLTLLLLLIPFATACGQESAEKQPSSSGGTSNTTSVADNQFPLEEKNFGDTEITILTRSKRYSQQFVPNEEYEGSVINTAVQNRNDYIEEKYGIKINVEETTRPGTEIGNYIATNIDDYDIVCDAVYYMVPTVVENWFYSLNDMLELNQPWWDQNANAYLTLSDKIFFVAGDAIFTDDLMTSAVFFNKDLYATYFESRYGSLYDIVKDGEWTYELMYSMAKEFARPDDDGNWMTSGAYYGITTDGYTGATMLTNGSGTVTASKDEQGNIVLNVATERSLNAFGYVYEMLKDSTTSLYVEQLTAESKWDDVLNMFVSNHALFRIAYIDTLLNIKESDLTDKVNPGVVPIPKYNEAQDSYYCGVNAYQSDVMGIPVTNTENLNATCYLMELLGYYSSSDSLFGTNSVTTAFYETTLKLQSVTDDDDSYMLDLVSNSRIYDLGGIFDWGGQLIGVYSYLLYQNSNDLVSKWDGIRIAVETAMQETIDAYKSSIN